jgi:hypothetical protein
VIVVCLRGTVPPSWLHEWSVVKRAVISWIVRRLCRHCARGEMPACEPADGSVCAP